MSTLIQFWRADGPNGEALITERRTKVLSAVIEAATARPSDCVLVTLADTRPESPFVDLWRRPGYISATGKGPGLLNNLKSHI